MKKGLETSLYSIVGVATVFAILIAVNAIGSRVKQRVDLTAEKAYTLSAGTKVILAKLDTPVQIRFYSSRNSSEMPVPLKTYAQRVEDLLGEYQQASKFIQLQKLDPTPDSDAEESAKLDGVDGQQMPNGDRIYLGVSVTMLDKKEALPFLTPDRDRLLEYDISRAISRVATPQKAVVGIMTPLQISGSSPMMARMGGASQPPWAFYTELTRDFDVKSVEMTAEKIPDEVKVLVLIHPKAITDGTQFAIDQFILRGGKLVAFLDPLAALDRAAQMGGGQTSSSSIDKLLKGWGIAFDTSKVVADMDYVSRVQRGREPSVLSLTDKAMNKEDILTASVDNLFMIFSGAFTGTPAAGLKETVLINSSANAELVDPLGSQISGGEDIIKNFKATGTEYPLAVRLEGKFKTAFPDGKPKAATPATPANPAEEKKPDEPAEAFLKESEKNNAVILVGDSDLLQDQVAVNVMENPLNGQRMVTPRNGNIGFAQSIVDQLTGEDALIAVRSRASLERPFTVVKAMEAKAEERFSGKIKEVEAKRQEAMSKITELQRAKGAGAQAQQFIMSAEQQQELANFRKEQAKAERELKQVHKEFTGEINSLSTFLKWLNIGLIPFLVALGGVLIAIQRHKTQAAR